MSESVCVCVLVRKSRSSVDPFARDLGIFFIFGLPLRSRVKVFYFYSLKDPALLVRVTTPSAG